MYEEGQEQDAYATLCGIIEKYPSLLHDGGTCTLWADLELAANNNAARAIELLDKARELDGKDLVYYYAVRAEAMWRLGDREQAMQNYEDSIAIDATVDNLTMYGQLLSDIDDGRAMDIWQQVIRKDRHNCTAHIYIGRESAKSGDRSKASVMAETAQKLRPTADDLFILGLLYCELDDYPNAIRVFLKAIGLGYKDKAVLYAAIAASHLHLDDTSQAQEYVQRALECNPNHAYAKEVSSQCEMRCRQQKEQHGSALE
jgi:tetratricopeptide (TPR) repeat protein